VLCRSCKEQLHEIVPCRRAAAVITPIAGRAPTVIVALLFVSGKPAWATIFQLKAASYVLTYTCTRARQPCEAGRAPAERCAQDHSNPHGPGVKHQLGSSIMHLTSVLIATLKVPQGRPALIIIAHRFGVRVAGRLPVTRSSATSECGGTWHTRMTYTKL
jgi:hypothetical protein